jgi:hypothetical protein
MRILRFERFAIDVQMRSGSGLRVEAGASKSTVGSYQGSRESVEIDAWRTNSESTACVVLCLSNIQCSEYKPWLGFRRYYYDVFLSYAHADNVGREEWGSGF